MIAKFVGRKRDDKSEPNDSCAGNEDELLLEAEAFYADSTDYGKLKKVHFSRNCVV